MLKWNVSGGAQPVWRKWVAGGNKRGREWLENNRLLQGIQTEAWSILLVGMAFLLGRAVILDALAPFALAYFAVMYFLRRDLHYWIGGALLAGSLLSPYTSTFIIAGEILIFLLIQKGLERYERAELSLAPIVVFISAFLVQLFSYVIVSELSWYAMLMTTVSAVLSFILSLIFIQAVPLFAVTKKRQGLRNEEIICLFILMASVMTGLVGWSVGSVSIEHIMSRYMILLFALVGGAPLGASVGVITGLILSLAHMEAIYQMSLLAFAGLLAGLLKEGKRLGVALGLLVGSSILVIYMGTQAEVVSSTIESLAAIALFLLTPRRAIQALSRYIPGTKEHNKVQYDYARRVRDVTAGRVEQFSEVFRQLAGSFKQFNQGEKPGSAGQESHFMNAVAEKTCANCWKRNQCWDDKFYRTYQYMTNMISAVENNPDYDKRDIPMEWKQSCVKTEAVLQVMKQQYDLYKHDLHWKKQIQDSRQLVAEQLSGVSRVMEDLAREIKREGQELALQEDQIRQALESMGLSIHGIDIISLDEGNVEIEMVHQFNQGFDECRKIIAPMLSNILGENIVVKNEAYARKGEGYHTVTFGSAKEYEVDTGIAGAAKGGGLLSGDSFSTMELGNGKFAVAISDGMGNGERARMESSAALNILQQLLQSGMDEQLAIKSVNSVLMLRSSDEMFATIDVALIDLYDASTTFLKTGSTPSFIKRGSEVMMITANNLPVGIIQDIEVELVSKELKHGDILIMMTDGIYDAPGYAVNRELWMKRVIQEISVEEPQQFADCLLESIVRYQQGEIMDDMTVVVAKVEKYKPEWATFRWGGFDRIERPKTVS